MKIRPIKTDADYRVAPAEIERLMDAAPGTPAGDRLEVLTTLLERYESLCEPIEPPEPLESLIYHMESRGLPCRLLQRIPESKQILEPSHSSGTNRDEFFPTSAEPANQE